MSSPQPESVEPRSARAGTFTLAVELSRPREENVFAIDYYEILRVGPQADEETIDRIYGTLADRFHPDNPSTGDPETFLRLKEAYETLSNKATRAKYNGLRHCPGGSTRFLLRGREFFAGVKGGQNRRLAVLCLLYRRRISTDESPGLSILDLEQLTGCTREELTSALWYLCEKTWAAIGEFTAYSITADGFDVVESKLENRLEFRGLATYSYYRLPAGTEDETDSRGNDRRGNDRKDTLPFDIDPVEGDVSLADHYEILGISPQADEEAIERTGRTLASRFHPDNPGTGDARTFRRIREAWDTLSDRSRRAQYDALRERTKYPARFRLRGREFFEGIKGEQLRRLALLCLLYRQSVSELPGLTVLDMEQLTGCTREELASALWYLREKKWARYGEFTEYSITATGFDVVENKLEDREAANSRAWLTPEHTTPEHTMEAEAMDIRVEEPSTEIVAVARAPILIAESSDIAQQVSEAEPEEREAPGFWDWLRPDDTWTNDFTYPDQESAVQEIEQSQPKLPIVPQTPGVRCVSNSTKRVILSMGGKGGVGKTSVLTGLAEWFEENQIPVTLLDLDTENKACGSLTHFFGGRVPKINIYTPAGLDAFVDRLGEGNPVILADQGAGAGQITHDWFEKMYPDVAATGAAFTAIGVVTSDPASVESVLAWDDALQHRVAYLIVENNLSEHSDFTYWRDRAAEFRQRFQPAVIRVDYRIADLENAARNHGVTLGRVAGRTTSAPELQKASLVMRAQSYRRRMFAEFDRVKELLLP
jgi:curved DNA-binding protein CbpA/MinD-like ATPase involved in chromosome partitioning or flagellar assembly